jgi:hypothetical protein
LSFPILIDSLASKCRTCPRTTVYMCLWLTFLYIELRNELSSMF